MDFVEARRKYGFFVAQYIAGKISAQELEKEISQLEVIDQYENRWQLGVKSGKWYRFDGSAWIEDLPPPPPVATPVDPSPTRTTGEFLPSATPSQTALSDPSSRRRRVKPQPAFPTQPPAKYRKPRKRRGWVVALLILFILVGIIGCLVILAAGIIILMPDLIPFSIQLY